MIGRSSFYENTNAREGKKHLKVVPGQTDSEETFGNIRKWLSDCLTNHEKCHSIQALTNIPCRRPSRLLDVSNHHVKLREDAPRGRYACLSHCWGSVTHMLRLTKENMADFRIHIPYQQLPQNFKDAIDICRRLGIYLLWIDALCIIQDSTEDWNREAPCMGVYYRDAVFTIAATSAKDSSGGCYTHAEPLEGPDWPLLQRGWVYQEMQLSTRKLHFAANEVIWDCSRGIRSESGTYDRNHSEKNSVLFPENPEIDWHRKVVSYSSLSLTFEDDRIPALSSITQWMEQLRPSDQFLLGLWERTLLLDLCWRTDSWASKRSKPRSVATKALPTWTWASMPAPVRY
ncbi:HET-domain-containing protein, partial [Acephala macrosclerotiorum]